MSVEEKIRRAEEIYYRRNNQNPYNYRKREYEKKGPTLKQRMIKQLIICLLVYGVFYVVTNRDYFLSQEFRGEVQKVASKNEHLNNVYNYVTDYIDKYFGSNNVGGQNPNNQNKENDQEPKNSGESNGKSNNQEQQNQEKQTEEQINQEQQSQETTSSIDNEQIQSNEENIGGAVEEVSVVEEKSEEQKDIEYIKNNISFIQPIQGTITSTFGWRTPTTPTVPKYHTGLDIAAATGTVIKSATDGKVVLASSDGDYGKHYKIQVKDLIVIYAHCSKLYLKEGDSVTQGQNIAEVGSTGNSTRSTSSFRNSKAR